MASHGSIDPIINGLVNRKENYLINHESRRDVTLDFCGNLIQLDSRLSKKWL